MKSILTVIVFAAVLTSRAALASVIFVNAGAGGADNGASWTHAYTDLQSALTRATSGDEIRVAAGTYRPTARTDPDDPRSAAFQLKNNVAIYGGFNGTEANRDERDWVENVTILSGDIGTEVDDTDNCYHVFYHPESLALNNTAILDGVTITKSQSEGSRSGGGMYNNSASPTLANCAFSDNSAPMGGGMYNKDSSPILTNCAFSGNSAPRGGGMYNEDLSSPILTNCAFSGNSADDGGGMLNDDESSPILTNCAFSDNSADRGGGMYNIGSSPILTNCAFSDNSAGAAGG
ncbi:MAG: right-handed parallel beta-helix repeat-containing protein, partial [Desulfobacterales bacterium]|nr:right-handed parallel beta-helix repeat-containing protein [Desulfobacterales bacterium]